MSFYEDKLVNARKSLKRGEWQQCQRLFFACASVDPSDTDECVEEKLKGLTFGQFLEHLPTVMNEDGHLAAQSSVLDLTWPLLPLAFTPADLTIMRIEDLDLDLLSEVWGIDARRKDNKSKRSLPSTGYFDASTAAMSVRLYKRDFESFDYPLAPLS